MAERKADKEGFFLLKSKEPWADQYTEMMKESQIEEHIKYIRKNTGLKRVNYHFKYIDGGYKQVA